MTDLSTSIDQAAIEDALDEWLAGGLDELDEAPADDVGAERLLGALAAVLRRQARSSAVVQARIQQLTDWMAEQDRQYDARAQHLQRLLEGWARAQHGRTGMKTFKLPSGELKLRGRQIRAELTDVPDALAPAIGRLVPNAVQTKTSVLISEIKKVVEPGELIAEWIGHTPEGYEARAAVLAGADDSGYVVVPGVVLLVPIAGPAGQAFSLKVRA